VPRLLDRSLDLRGERIARGELAGIGPGRNAQPFERLPKSGDVRIVMGGMGDEDVPGHAGMFSYSTALNGGSTARKPLRSISPFEG